MSTFKTTEEAREYFKKDVYAYHAGMILDELGEDYAVCSLPIHEGLLNANGGVQGGAIFTLADLAFAALANNLHMPTVAQQVSVNFLNAPKGTRLIARAEIKKDGRASSVINVSVADDTGRDIAQYVGTGFKL
ncbi:MAG: PaaI family thioesterase [Clostridia bacterium]|nr:PaaI family thioesterase [Clostridia bacterium]